jgi:Protein of unknown function (DUF3999)
MKSFAATLAFLLLTGAPASHLKYQRPVQLSSTATQQYFVIDDTIWTHARSDLADLRLYADQTEIAYALVTEKGSLQQERTPVRILQQSTVAGKTQFLIDMSGVAEYDHIDLNLTTENFVAHARVQGEDDLHAKNWATLGDGILYDLSRENLGSNHTLRLTRSTYKFLRVSLDGPIKPEEVQGAISEGKEEEPAHWRNLDGKVRQEQKDKDTIFTFEIPDNIPVERVAFDIDPAQPNFWRKVEIQTDKDRWLGSGEIKRVHLVRAGQKIDSEEHEVNFSGYPDTTRSKAIKVIIHNGDDPPLKLTAARLQQLERRLYFDNPGFVQLMLYYGDRKVEVPVYDYAKLFQRDKAAAAAQLGDESTNPAYTEYADDRPWSERHPVVLWIAILAAVLILATLAVRSMRTATA